MYDFAWRLHVLASAAILLSTALLYFLAVRNRFTATGLWLPLVGPLIVQTGVALATAAFSRHRETRREREHLSTALARYLPAQIAEQLAREIEALRQEEK